MNFRSKMLSHVCLVLVLFASIGFATKTYAANQKTFSIAELVDQFYAQKDSRKMTLKLFNQQSVRPPVDCHPQGPSCLDAACAKLGSFGCDDMSEVQAVSRACRGNYDGNCLNVACQKLGHFGCDDMSEIQSVARACVGNYETDCFESVCRRLGSFGCDDMHEVEEVLRSCSGN